MSWTVYIHMVNGKTNALCVEPSHTVFSVKKAMEELTGVQTSHQKLVFNGRELGDDQATLATCGVKSYSKLILAPLIPPSPATAAAAAATGILVKTLSGKSIHVQGSLSDTVEEVCMKIQKAEGIALEQLQLIYGGKVLDWDVPLRGYNIQEGSALHMVCTSSQRRVLIRMPAAMTPSSSSALLPAGPGAGGAHHLVPLVVMLNDTVETLRGRIVAKFKLPTSEQQQELYFEGVRLEPGRELRHYPIKTNSIIDIQLCSSSSSSSSQGESLSQQDLFVRTPWGKVVTVSFLPSSDTVRSIKEKVHAKTGMAPGSQVLLLAGSPLGDAVRLGSCNISTESSFQLVLRENGEEEEEDPVQIFVRTMMGETFALEAFPSDTIGGVKAKIRDRMGLPVTRQSLLMRGEPLADSVKLRDCNIDTESTFYLTLSSGTPAKDTSDVSDANLDSANPDSAPEIIFIRNLLGKSISIEVLPTDRVRDLKERIFAKEGIRVEEQNLVFHGSSLGDEELIRHHNIDQESNLQLALTSPEKIKSSLNTPAGSATMIVKYMKRTIPLSINLDDKITKAKVKICEKEGISPNRQRLLYQGRELEDSRSFSYYRINQRSTLVLVLRGSQKSCKVNVQLPSGKITSVGFDAGDTVASLKRALQHSERVPVSRQSILDEHGSVLRDEVEISSSQHAAVAASGSVVLSMVVSPIRTLSVVVAKSHPDSRPRVISVGNVATVDDLRAKVMASLLDLPATSMLNFFHEGKHLTEESSHTLQEDSVIMLDIVIQVSSPLHCSIDGRQHEFEWKERRIRVSLPTMTSLLTFTIHEHEPSAPRFKFPPWARICSQVYELSCTHGRGSGGGGTEPSSSQTLHTSADVTIPLHSRQAPTTGRPKTFFLAKRLPLWQCDLMPLYAFSDTKTGRFDADKSLGTFHVQHFNCYLCVGYRTS